MLPHTFNHLDWSTVAEISKPFTTGDIQGMLSSGFHFDTNLNYLLKYRNVLHILKSCKHHIPLPPYSNDDRDNLAILYNHKIIQATHLQYFFSKYLVQYHHQYSCELSAKDQLTSQNSSTDISLFPNSISSKSAIPSFIQNEGDDKRYFNNSFMHNDFVKRLDIYPTYSDKNESHVWNHSSGTVIDLSKNSLEVSQMDSNINYNFGIQNRNIFSSIIEREIPSNYSKFVPHALSRSRSISSYSYSSKRNDLTQYKTSNIRKSYSIRRKKSLSIAIRKSPQINHSRDFTCHEQRNAEYEDANENELKYGAASTKKSNFRGTSEEENEICEGFCPKEMNNRVILSDTNPTVTLPIEIYQSLIKKSASSATRLIRLLMKSFFSQQILAASSLSGEGIYKSRLQPEITEAIKCFIRSRHPLLKTGSINLCMTDVCVQARRVANNQRKRYRPCANPLIVESLSTTIKADGALSCHGEASLMTIKGSDNTII